jgi:hypothetical protein
MEVIIIQKKGNPKAAANIIKTTVAETLLIPSFFFFVNCM